MTYELQRFIFIRKLLLQGSLNLCSALDAPDLSDFRNIQNKYGFECDDSFYVLKRKLWISFSNVIDTI